MVDFRRGFKADAERNAVAVRNELGLGVLDRLSSFDYAEYLHIPVRPISAIQANASDIDAVRDCLSAFTIFKQYARTIFYNDSHSSARLQNSVMHELSHEALEHQPEISVVNSERQWNALQEEEATWLAGALLVPRSGLELYLRDGRAFDSGPAHFGVSVEVFKWRYQVTGMSRQLQPTR